MTLADLSNYWCVRDVTGEHFITFDADENDKVVDALSNLVAFIVALCEEVGSYDFEGTYVVMKKGVAEWLSVSMGLPHRAGARRRRCVL